MRKITYAQAINEALTIAMESNEQVICYGLGVPDPKGVFGTTTGLQDKFGADRVFDTPISENALTGVAIGASMNGIRPIMTHQRLDFFLLAMDQLVNNAAKWHYMFGSQTSIPITIRLLIGHGWGQGPTHSQNLQAVFSHIPGLKVVMPTFAADAKGLLLSSIFDENPVVFLEHRWLHAVEGNVPEGDFRIPLGVANVIQSGSDLTIISMSYMTIEALRAVEALNRIGVSCELIDLRSISPLDWDCLFTSVKKTGRVVVLDTGAETGSVAGEIVARITMNCFEYLKAAPRRVAMPDFPTPTSRALTLGFYRRAEDILEAVKDLLKLNFVVKDIFARDEVSHDVPGDWFKGPF